MVQHHRRHRQSGLSDVPKSTSNFNWSDEADIERQEKSGCQMVPATPPLRPQPPPPRPPPLPFLRRHVHKLNFPEMYKS
ncbi:hypothetical protein LSAT2_025572 [Lamellibrachia satsuma]|nr:hypothetical protein LSAT2_025572 [Lamellibrachia satsuma]